MDGDSQLKVLLVHNYYQIAGGEDSVFRNEIQLLRDAGHTVITYTLSNDSIKGISSAIQVVLRMCFSFKSYSSMRKLIRREQPDVVHVHNYFPLITPSVFYACSKEAVPVVHTLHNYRAICPTALLMSDGKINEKSVTGSPWWAVRKKVYRDSFLGTATLSFMIWLHRYIGTWQTKVDGFICLTNFAKDVYRRAGWPDDKLFLKPNFINHDQINTEFIPNIDEPYALYVGRLSEEKGVDLLIEAWKNVPFKLIVIGEGPLSILFDDPIPNVKFLGRQSKHIVLGYMKHSQFLVMASTWYEGLPMVLIEAFAMRKPALVPKLGGMAEVVLDGVNGVHFTPGSSESLCKHALKLAADPVLCSKMGKSARVIFDSNYSEEVNLRLLTDIYSHVINKSHGIE